LIVNVHTRLWIVLRATGLSARPELGLDPTPLSFQDEQTGSRGRNDDLQDHAAGARIEIRVSRAREYAARQPSEGNDCQLVSLHDASIAPPVIGIKAVG
jgi:hypothetical protein